MAGKINTLDALEVLPTGAALGAEVRGVDLSKPVSEELRSALKQAWYDHLVLLFRKQTLDPESIAGIGDLFGGAQETTRSRLTRPRATARYR